MASDTYRICMMAETLLADPDMLMLLEVLKNEYASDWIDETDEGKREELWYKANAVSEFERSLRCLRDRKFTSDQENEE